jgi:hypothetical protein
LGALLKKTFSAGGAKGQEAVYKNSATSSAKKSFPVFRGNLSWLCFLLCLPKPTFPILPRKKKSVPPAICACA